MISWFFFNILSERLLFYTNQTFVIMASTSYNLTRWWWGPLCTRSNWIFIVLVNFTNSPQIDMTNYQFYSLSFNLTGVRTHDLPHSTKPRYRWHHQWCCVLFLHIWFASSFVERIIFIFRIFFYLYYPVLMMLFSWNDTTWTDLARLSTHYLEPCWTETTSAYFNMFSSCIVTNIYL